jgi:thiol-disulfide isomerase/thioredoxin
MTVRLRAAEFAGIALFAMAAAAAGCARAGSARLALEPVTGRDVLEAARQPGARATLVNVWATWCAPCRDEFPDLVRLQRSYADRGLRVLFVSGDFADARPHVEAFLLQHGVSGRTFIKDQSDQEFIDTLDARWSGALPATFVFGADGSVRDFWEGSATYEELERRIAPALAAPGT